MVRWLVWGALPCPLRSRWDREFESPLLQRGVSWAGIEIGNFVRYLNNRRNIFPRIVENEDQVRRHVRDFLLRELDLRVGVSTRDPFKGLEVYSQDDAEVFFGRDAERRKAVQELAQLWDDDKLPTFYGVTGGSGVGKSSMARAALVGHLCHRTSRGRYAGCVVRPTDLLAAPAPGAQPYRCSVCIGGCWHNCCRTPNSMAQRKSC
jgi:hypothetical protein